MKAVFSFDHKPDAGLSDGVRAWPAVELDPGAILPSDDPEAVMLDLTQPQLIRGWAWRSDSDSERPRRVGSRRRREPEDYDFSELNDDIKSVRVSPPHPLKAGPC